MLKRIYRCIPALCLILCMAACSKPEPFILVNKNANAPTEATAETAAALPDSEAGPRTDKETEPASTPETETAAPPETQTQDPSMPVLLLPEAEEGTCLFYDDAAFIGDSISYSLMVHNAKTHELGNAQFLVRGSLGIHNSLNGQLSIQYRGRSLTPWEALSESGAKKVFLMLGMNDIGYYSIDETITLWGTFLDNIRKTCPDIQIYIQSLTPMWIGSEQKLLNNANIDAYNLRLRELAEEYGCHYVHIAPYFKDSNNGLAEAYCGDMYVHMNEKGIAAWVTVLKAYARDQIYTDSQ